MCRHKQRSKFSIPSHSLELNHLKTIDMYMYRQCYVLFMINCIICFSFLFLARILVGAPRDNFTDKPEIPQPGNVYACPVNFDEDDQCSVLYKLRTDGNLFPLINIMLIKWLLCNISFNFWHQLSIHNMYFHNSYFFHVFHKQTLNIFIWHI